jgi:hypothetical protein
MDLLVLRIVLGFLLRLLLGGHGGSRAGAPLLEGRDGASNHAGIRGEFPHRARLV